MSFGSRLGRARLAIARLASLAGQLPFKEVALRLRLDINTVHTAIRLNLARTRDVASRFNLAKTADVALRFPLRVQAFKDVASRVQFWLTGGPGSGQIFYLSNEQANYTIPFGTQNAAFSAGAGSNSGSPYEDRALRLHRGTSQTQNQVSATGVGTKNLYPARFVFGPLAAQHVNAGSWVYAIAAGSGNPSNADSSPQIYTWRPSTGAVVTRIRDSTSGIAAGTNTSDVETGYVRTLDVSNGGGGPAFDTLDGDYLVIEPWWTGTQGTIGTRTREIWYGGTTEVIDGSSPTNAASYLKAPQLLLFLNPAETHLRFNLARTRDVAMRLWLQTPIYKDTATRFQIRAPVYKDVAGRFKLLQTAAKDVHTLVWLRIGGYAFEPLRFHLANWRYKDAATRVEVRQGDSYQDVATRTVFRPLAYKDPAVRLSLPSWTYRDVACLLSLQVVYSFQDVATRFALPTISAQEPVLRFQLQEESFQGLAELDANGVPVWQVLTFP